MRKSFNFTPLICALFLLLATSGCQDPAAPQRPQVQKSQAKASPATSPLVIYPDSHDELRRIFALNNYDLDTLDSGVPKLIVNTLPADLDRVNQTSEKKRIFFLTLLPMVLMANEEIQAERDQLHAVFSSFDEGRLPSAGELERLNVIQRKYKVKGDPLIDCGAREKLLARVDILPPSLVLAQAANESAWGTSRFAQVANNIFGEWTFTPGAGIVPENRPEGEIYEVRRFPTIYDSLKSYMRNLNTNRAYAPLRELRAEMRRQERPLLGTDLARGLIAYSTRREEYVAEIAAMIRHNKLFKLSQINLRGS